MGLTRLTDEAWIAETPKGVLTKKNKQHVTSKIFENIPLLDFSQEWTDEKIYKEFDLTQDEIDFINKHIPKYYE